MKNFSLFIKNKNKKNKHYSKNKGPVTVPMFSDFFSSTSNDMFVTNAMYSSFKESILSTIDIYHPKSDITISVFEEKQSDEEKREIVEIGFKKYIEACYLKAWREWLNGLITVSIFAIVGILVIILGFGLKKLTPEWVFHLITNLGTVLLWQFVGYWAFEYAGQKRELDRLKQVENIKFIFKRWE